MKKNNYLLIISFLAIIFIIPIIGMMKQDNEISTIENRKLQSFPVLNKKNIEEFTGKFDNYVVDQFPSRDRLLDIYTKVQLMERKIKIRNTIVLENWLFVRDYKVDEGYLNGIANSIKEVVSKNKNVDFYYIILPSKTAMLADLYPKYMDGNISKNNNEILKKRLEDIEELNIVNVLDKLLDEYSPEERRNYYYQSDFHWNAKGAFKAFELMINHIKDYETFKAAEDKLRRVEYRNKYFNGDLERRFSGNIKNTDMPDVYEIIDTQDLIYYKSIDNTEQVKREEIITPNINKDIVGYNDIYTYNLSCIRITNKNPIIDKKVLVFKDSYFNAMVEPMSIIFSELIIIDPRYYNENYSYNEIIEEKSPDYVFFCYHQSNIDKDLIKFLKD